MIKNHFPDIVANATIGEAIPLEEEAGTARGKRSTGEDVDKNAGGEDEVEEKCRVAMWVSHNLHQPFPIPMPVPINCD